MVMTQRIEYHDLTNTKGLLALNLGKTRITSHYNNLIHIINVKNLEVSLKHIKTTILDDKFNQSNLYNPNNLKLQLLRLEEKVNSLKPISRNKRGLFDGLGTIIKQISGNMDHNDALEINEQIRQLQDNELLIKNNANNQHKLNDKMIERFNNITAFINQEQSNLRTIALAVKTYPHIEQQLFQSQFYFSIQSQIQYLSDHVNDILNSIQLAKLGIISKHILNKAELSLVRENLSKQLPILNDEHLYELLQLKAYYNESNIIFTIMIPQFSNITLSTIKIRPLPENHQIIKPESNYILYNPDKYIFISKPCNRIEQTFICPPKTLQETSTNQCEIKILENQPARCTLHRTMEDNFIEEIEDNHILINTKQQINITNSCGKNMTNFIGKLHIVLYSCKLCVNQIVYGTLSTSTNKIELEQILYNAINITNISEEVNLNLLHLQHLENTEELELLRTQHIYHVSISAIIIILIILCFIANQLYSKCYKHTKIIPKNIPSIQFKPTAPPQADTTLTLQTWST